MDPRKTENSFRPSVEAIIDDQNLNTDPELEACVGIMSKPHPLRNDQDIERFVNKVINLEIFGRSLLENLGARTIIKKLMPFMKVEVFQAGKPIFHYEQSSDKMYILLRGKAKEFMPKGIDEIETESHQKYGAFQYLQGVPISFPELARPETPTSVSSLHGGTRGLLSSLNTISEEGDEEGGTSEATKKRFRKLKAVLPFLKKMNNNKGTVQNAEEYRYKRTIKKVRSILKPILADEDINLEALERELGIYVVEELMKYPKAYFIGGILKIKFSKYLYPGSHCGIRALRDNSLRSRAVFAEEDCYCVSLHRDDFIAVLENEKALNIDKIEFFKKMFNMFDERTVIEFALLWENQACKGNEVVFQQNDSPNYLYVICTGEIMLTKTISQNQNRKQFFAENLPYRIKRKNNPDEHTLRVATICSGDFFGEEDFFEEKSREFTATVISTKAKVYRLHIELTLLKKYKHYGKNYSDIIREIRRLMSLKTGWKNERLEGLYQHHNTLIQEKIEKKENTFEKQENLKNLGLISPETMPSSLRLQMKLMERAKTANTNLIGRPTFTEKDTLAALKTSPEKPLESIRENTQRENTQRDGEGNTSTVHPRRLHIKQNSHGDIKSLVTENSELGMFSRATVPRQYNPIFDELLKQSTEVVRLDFKEHATTTRPSTKRVDLRSKDHEPKRPTSQSRDGGLSSASIRLMKKKFLRKKTKKQIESPVLAIRDYPELLHKRTSSIEIEAKAHTQELNHSSSINVTHTIQSFGDKLFKQCVVGQSITTPTAKEKVLITSLDRLDKFDKGSLSTLDTTSRQTMSKGTLEVGTLSKIGEEMHTRRSSVGREVIHTQGKAKTSFRILKGNTRRRDSCKLTNESTQTQNSKDHFGEGTVSFRILGEKAGTKEFPMKQTGSLRNIKCVNTINVAN